ncbi:PREDICTED: neural Wiskott-Aldrich syndrome protein-like [Nicotiana attenuata]|uniref:neural Wiskott-Aldrich syndrome protein-like n=1 Tax=Nicotiana attenuata TaxID=49451 RepID=UPI0009053279|nr:PREDICTED: neural Wiskott-Aldrich syndrome protein-like [Nicotiana attenuata]
MYFRDLKVEKKWYDVKAKPVAPFSWYSLRGPDNPKDKTYKPPAPTSASTLTGQSEEPVVTEAPTKPTPDPPPGPSTSTDLPPGPSTPAGPGIPSSRKHPITAHQLSQALYSMNNWMSAATSKFSTLSSTIEAQSAPQIAQIPQSIEDTLKKLLENQEKMMKTQDALSKAVESQGKALKQLAREHKKMRKSRAPAVAPVAEPQQEQTQRLPRKKRKIPSADDAVIQLADPQEVSSSLPHDAPDIQQVQEQAPILELVLAAHIRLARIQLFRGDLSQLYFHSDLCLDYSSGSALVTPVLG